ncbi:hypothetical protein MHYP_G00317810 [Metynnis hypsauchen]
MLNFLAWSTSFTRAVRKPITKLLRNRGNSNVSEQQSHRYPWWSLKWRKLVHIVSDSARSFRLLVDQTEEEFWR